MGSLLRLCQLGPNNEFELWASLAFEAYEDMVLFYETFVAMKRQDSRVPSDNKLHESALELGGEEGEALLFSGEMQDGEMRLALRVSEEKSCGVIRLAAAILDGARKTRVAWTAFVTIYDQLLDWAELQSETVVALGAVQPPPNVFIPNFHPAKSNEGKYILQFTRKQGNPFFR